MLPLIWKRATWRAGGEERVHRGGVALAGDLTCGASEIPMYLRARLDAMDDEWSEGKPGGSSMRREEEKRTRQPSILWCCVVSLCLPAMPSWARFCFLRVVCRPPLGCCFGVSRRQTHPGGSRFFPIRKFLLFPPSLPLPLLLPARVGSVRGLARWKIQKGPFPPV